MFCAAVLCLGMPIEHNKIAKHITCPDAVNVLYGIVTTLRDTETDG